MNSIAPVASRAPNSLVAALPFQCAADGGGGVDWDEARDGLTSCGHGVFQGWDIEWADVAFVVAASGSFLPTPGGGGGANDSAFDSPDRWFGCTKLRRFSAVYVLNTCPPDDAPCSARVEADAARLRERGGTALVEPFAVALAAQRLRPVLSVGAHVEALLYQRALTLPLSRRTRWFIRLPACADDPCACALDGLRPARLLHFLRTLEAGAGAATPVHFGYDMAGQQSVARGINRPVLDMITRSRPRDLSADQAHALANVSYATGTALEVSERPFVDLLDEAGAPRGGVIALRCAPRESTKCS
jgi:hypothetical protein